MPVLPAVSLLAASLVPLAAGAQVTASGSAVARPGSLHAPFVGAFPPSARSGPARERRRSFLEVDGDGDAGRVLYYVYSDSRFYDTRLRWVLDTWAQKVPQGDLTVIGDAPFNGNSSNARVLATDCPRHSHWEGACCKYAQAVRQAYEEMQRDPSVNWAYFVDDDAYVRPEVLSAALAGQADPQDHGVALGNLGCATKECKFSICAGGGYAANRKAVYTAIAGSEDALQLEEMNFCAKCERWADAAMTQVFLEKHIELRPLAGLNGWKLKKAQFDQSIDGREPIMYHYIQSQTQMEFLHRLFAGAAAPAEHRLFAGAAAPADAAGDDPEQCVTYRGEARCAASASPQDTPWVPDDHERALALIELCEAED